MKEARSKIPAKAARKLAELAVTLVRQVDETVLKRQPADVVLSHYFAAHKEFGSRDRRFLSEVVFSFFRWKGWISSASANTEKACVASYLLDADEVHPSILLLAEKAGIPQKDLAACEGKSTETKALLVKKWLGTAKTPMIGDVVPKWVEKQLFVPKANAKKHVELCLNAFQVRPPAWLRMALGQEETVQKLLKREGIKAVPHKKLGNAGAVAGSSAIRSLDLDIRAHFEIQDLASQCVGFVCEPKTGEHWWDVCSGAGGKALHLADLMQNRGTILATDVRPNALEESRRRAKVAGVTCIRTRVLQESEHEINLPANNHHISESYDGVLVDAPCSGMGTWSRNPDARWRIQPEDVKAKAILQADILNQAARSVRTGGKLVYAVCTITKNETTDVIEKFLEDHYAFELDPVPHPLTGIKTDGTVWIWPWQGPCDGMFIARMIRK